MPGFTHLKNAQPISFAHYILAYVEIFNRDKKRLIKNFDSLKETLWVLVHYQVHHLILTETLQQKNLVLKFLQVIQLILFRTETLF